MIKDYQNKEITSVDEKTKVFESADVVAAPSAKPKVEYSFPAEGFAVMASSLEEAEAALAAHKKTKNT